MTTTPQFIEATFREQHGRVLAALVARFGDLGLAEDGLQDACVLALKQWPSQPPSNPAAWLTTVARRRIIDRLRAEPQRLALPAEDVLAADEDLALMEPESFADERLKLMFMCCHPALSLEAQVALTLRSLGGLTTEEVARAFLVSTETMAQRLARARHKIRAAGIPFGDPPAEQLPERLDALMAIIYLIFNEGYSASAGEAVIRQEVCAEAIRLGRVLTTQLPERARLRAEPLGLLALMLLHDSRRAARIGPMGEVVLLADQERHLWHRAQIEEGLSLLDTALALGAPGPYQLQAAISALHATAASYADTDWRQIEALYAELMRRQPSSVIAVNHAVAFGMAHGASQGLRVLFGLYEQAAGYYPYHAALAHFLAETGQREAAADAYRRAADLCSNAGERAYFENCIRKLES